MSGVHPRAPHRPRIRFLTYLLVSWIANAVVLGIVAWIFADVRAGTTGQLVVAAAVFGVLNTILKPILRLLTLPFAVITLGLVWFFVSMFMLWLTSLLVSGFDVDGLLDVRLGDGRDLAPQRRDRPACWGEAASPPPGRAGRSR